MATCCRPATGCRPTPWSCGPYARRLRLTFCSLSDFRQAWILGRHPDYWDQPSEFRPERWFGQNGGKKVPAFQQPPFIPFQCGPRTCLGLNMAFLEVKVMAVLVLQRFRLRAACTPAPRRAITLSVAGGMMMTVEPRTGPK